jgi:hypothetical protein
VVDSFQELAGDRDAGPRAALLDLVDEAVGDQLQPLFDQLVVDLPLTLDLVRGLEAGGEPGLELAEANVVQARGVDVVAGHAAAGAATQLDRAIDGPVGVLGCQPVRGSLDTCRPISKESRHENPTRPQPMVPAPTSPL